MPNVVVPVNGATSAARAYARALRRRFGDAVVDVRLFGSVVRGEANEDSDVDVAVVLRELDHATYGEVIDVATMTGLDFDVLLSPTAFDTATYDKWRRQERPLVMDIEGEGIVL